MSASWSTTLRTPSIICGQASHQRFLGMLPWVRSRSRNRLSCLGTIGVSSASSSGGGTGWVTGADSAGEVDRGVLWSAVTGTLHLCSYSGHWGKWWLRTYTLFVRWSRAVRFQTTLRIMCAYLNRDLRLALLPPHKLADNTSNWLVGQCLISPRPLHDSHRPQLRLTYWATPCMLIVWSHYVPKTNFFVPHHTLSSYWYSFAFRKLAARHFCPLPPAKE